MTPLAVTTAITPRSDCHEHPEFGDGFGTAPTPREVEVIAEVVQHGSEKEAAACLGLARQTVSNHVSRLHRRLGSTSIAQATAYLGWLAVPAGATRPHERDAG